MYTTPNWYAMQKIILFFIIILMIACNNIPDNMHNKYHWPENTLPPVAAKIPKELLAHNDKRIDDYYWMNDRKNPEVIKYLEAENSYTDTMLSGTNEFQDKLYTEMKSRIQEKDESVPY